MIWDFTTYTRRELYKFATCMFFTRSKGDRVEIYLVEIATAAFEARRRVIHHFGLKPKEVAEPYDLIVLMIADAVVHEWLHHETRDLPASNSIRHSRGDPCPPKILAKASF